MKKSEKITKNCSTRNSMTKSKSTSARNCGGKCKPKKSSSAKACK